MTLRLLIIALVAVVAAVIVVLVAPGAGIQPFVSAFLFAVIGAWALASLVVLLSASTAAVRLLTVGALVLTLGLSFVIPGIGLVATFVFFGGFILLVLTLLALGFRALRRARPDPRWLIVALAFIFSGTAVPLAALASAPPVLPAGALDLDAELAYLAETDQHDRYRGVSLFPWRDNQRLMRVLELVRVRPITSAQSQFNAALVLQHGRCPSDFELAHHLASASASTLTDAEWLVRATYDRWQLSLGKPARYGTQLTATTGGAECASR